MPAGAVTDRSSPGKKWIEDEIDKAIAFYQGQIEERRWYGFWDFGDVMHSYDSTRHEWRYDVGGFAWANTELMPDLWRLTDDIQDALEELKKAVASQGKAGGRDN